MATFGEVIEEIGMVVPRPGLDSLIRNKVNQAIRFISSSGYFWRDIVETTINQADGVEGDALLQAIPISSAVRKLIYIRYPLSSTRIHLVSLEALKKRRGCDALRDIGYLSGSSLHLIHSEFADSFSIAYYTNPVNFLVDGTEDENTNWILDTAPGLVVDMTAAYVLTLIGDTSDSKRISDLASIMRSTYIRDFVSSVEGD